MKLSTRLGLVVGFAALGTAILVIVALQILRATMLEDRRTRIVQTLNMVVRQASVYIGQEKGGKLTREEAQMQAKQAAAGLRAGDDYVIVRDYSGVLLVIPDPKRVGKVDLGAKGPDGRTTHQIYLDALKATDVAVVEIMTPRPGESAPVPKLIGVAKVPEWNWIVGFGLFIDDIDSAYRQIAFQLCLIGGAVFILAMAAAFVMARKIYRALGGEPEGAVTLARAIADGDLTQRIGQIGAPGSLMDSIRLMQQNLHDIIETIKQNADKVGETSGGLTGQMEEVNRASQQSSDAIASTAAAIDEMAGSVEQISQSARETEKSALMVSGLAGEGAVLVNNASEEFKRASLQVEQASAMIAGLVERSHEIGGIARVIKEIADQTNLLALNAAIEAARAGEQGRGFAVVADEVRKLAERTGQATDQITGMISAIHQDTSNVVSSMQAVGPQVGLGVEIIAQAGVALRQISDAAEVAKNNVSNVAAATSEQSQASSEVSRSVERISCMVLSSVEAVKAAEGNVRVLEQLANQLRASVERFRT